VGCNSGIGGGDKRGGAALVHAVTAAADEQRRTLKSRWLAGLRTTDALNSWDEPFAMLRKDFRRCARCTAQSADHWLQRFASPVTHADAAPQLTHCV
jgi:hypothetical protein